MKIKSKKSITLGGISIKKEKKGNSTILFYI
jgi:hypothetical protein